MSKRNLDIDRLISLHLSGRASKRERKELEQWISSSSANKEVFKQIQDIWMTPSFNQYDEDITQERDRIWAAGESERKTNVTILPVSGTIYWSKVAAIFLLVVTGAWLLNSILKGNAILSETVAMVEHANPAGQRSSHRLTDGTRVWLNAESSLSYPENFSDTLRLVSLSGEAFFEVTRDQQRPFVVEAAGTQTQALGTSFNIQAYPDGSIIKVALLEGKVRVQNKNQIETAFLSPGEELLVRKDVASFVKQQAKYDQSFGWKDGILFFDGSNLKNFCNTIEKWYGVKVNVKGNPPEDWNIRARYQRESLQHVLQDISFNKNIKFELHNKQVTVTF